MARAQDQRRWRANTARQRIEAYLPVDNVVQLDALAAARGASRAAVIAALITEAAGPAVEASDQTSTAEPEPTPPVAQPTPAPAAAGVEPDETPASTGRYTFHRPRRAEDKRYEWIAETAEGTRIALGRDPVRYYRWRGVILDGSLYLREAKGNRREDVVAQLMQ